ncbi:ninein-like protein isoform X3 [Halichoeres trimaculatus]|uniref:ninein-like protein isoform X3 n=1 Tax=Halichoeres trimaculatus TaxID=147232 RepID=UPI003D9DC588
MEEAEHSRYVAQLKAEFDSCDTTATGFLDREELVTLCRKLQLDAHLPLLLDTLLGARTYARVNFEEFKEGFVAVLSRSLDFSTSEDDSSYLEPVVPEEVKPKFVKGTKRYGRRSRPDNKPDPTLAFDCKDLPLSRHEVAHLSPSGVRRVKLRRSTSLESVESLKSDEEPRSQKENIQPDFQNKGAQQKEVDLGVVGVFGGPLSEVSGQLGLQNINREELDLLLRKLDPDLDGRVSIRDFQNILRGSPPITCSTPVRSADLQRAPQQFEALSEEHSARSTTPSLLTATVGQRVLSLLDDGSGCTTPDQVIALWTEEGIRNSRDILQTLDFPLEERLSLADLTLALDNELLVSGNGIHQAALISYKNEIQHLQLLAEQACRERDKLKADLELADQRNLQLVREVDDRHASMETLNQSRIRDLEQDFRDRLTALRSQSEQESEVLLQQVERERSTLQDQLQLIRVQEAQLQEELCSTTQENHRLQEELNVMTSKLTEAGSSVIRVQRDLDQLLHDKFGSLDPSSSGLSHEERFTEIVKDYELQCRELRDRNDELSSELELLKSQSDRKPRQRDDDPSAALSWTQQQHQQQQHHQQHTESDSDESDMRRSSSPLVRKKLQPADKTALGSLDVVSGPAVSIQTELALEQLKQKHQEELQQLNIQLETQVNYYERSLEMMRQSMEVERKDISQAFKMEISELEEQKAQVEQKVKQLKETVDKMQAQIQHGGGGGWSNEQERRVQRERAELEQNFAREIGNLVQRLSAEKDQLEAELRLKMDQEVMRVRAQLEESISFMESQEALNKRLDSKKSSVEEELQSVRSREEQLLLQVSQQKEELGKLQTASRSIQQDRELVADNCSRLSSAFIQQQAQLRAREQAVHALRAQMESLQGALKTRTESLSKKTAELDSMKTDRDRLIQDLKDQAMAVDHLQLELDSLSEELDRKRCAEEVLQEALKQEQTKILQIQSNLEVEREEVHCLSQEKAGYTRLADQLSTQIVEMEEEISTLRDHLRELSSQLNETADLVLNLRGNLNSKSSEVDGLRVELAEVADLLQLAKTSSEKDRSDNQKLTHQLEEKDSELNRVTERVLHLQQSLQDHQDQQMVAQQGFEQEKSKIKQQLVELEMLVLALETVMDPASPHRAQLEEVRSENGALQERLSVLQQEVQNLEDDVCKKRRKLEQMEKEHERSREEEEKLHKENSRYREEVLDLSSRNLQLSNDNAELSARLRGDQQSVQMLQERLTTVSKGQDEEAAMVRQLQDAAVQQERERQQQQVTWAQEKHLLETELHSNKEKLARLSGLEEELSSLTLKLQFLEEDKSKLLREADSRDNKVEKLQQSLLAEEAEAELLRSQLHAINQEKLGHTQEVSDLQGALQKTQRKLEELETSLRRLMREKEELSQALEEQEKHTSITLQEETHKLRVQNQELQVKMSEMQVQGLEVYKLTQEHQNLKTKLDELETVRMQAEDQALLADTALSLVQAQHQRQLQELQERAGSSCREQVEALQARLGEEQRRSQQLEEQLRLHNQQSSSQLRVKQDQYEKAIAALQQRMEELETKMKGVRLVLQEKVQQLKEQMAKNSKSSVLLKDLYVENSQLMKALQVTEQRQKSAERKNFLLEEKVHALNKLLREIVPASLAT